MQVLTENLKADGLRQQRTVFEQLGPLRTTILVGAVLEVAVPLLTMWLSDVLLFDIPRWALGWLFGVPPVVAICAALGCYIMKAHDKKARDRRNPL